MKITFTVLTLSLLSFVSCEQKDIERGTTTVVVEGLDSDTKIISLEALQNRQQQYLDREVTLATYLFTHEEGAWVGDSPDRPLWNSMSLRIRENSELVSTGLSHRWWFEYQDGFPVILTGIYRISDLKKHGHTFKNHPFIEVTRAVEVDIDDPKWSQNKKKSNKSEQATPRKPSD